MGDSPNCLLRINGRQVDRRASPEPCVESGETVNKSARVHVVEDHTLKREKDAFHTVIV